VRYVIYCHKYNFNDNIHLGTNLVKATGQKLMNSRPMFLSLTNTVIGGNSTFDFQRQGTLDNYTRDMA
jgi:hypothetical protein